LPIDDNVTAAERHAGSLAIAAPPLWMHGILRECSIVGAHIERATATPLAGGVSSDIYRVDAGGRTLCVKRALPRLKVAADWQVPVERSAYEAEWFRVAAMIVPKAVPGLLAEDPAAGAFAMEWLPPDQYPVWKLHLREGVIDAETAARVGGVLGRLHAATADRPDLAERFSTDDLFRSIRLEPYLTATGRAHPDLAAGLATLADRTAATRRVLVHGDFSPKNLLIGPDGPVVVDAECAWYGDPAFDLAFVLNHLLLKGAWQPQWRSRYVELFGDLVDAYRSQARWEPWPDVEHRAAALLPALLLARVDGKSPVEYLTDDMAREVRAFARRQIVAAPVTLQAIASQWRAS
jgi:aminoglycoside phosphotransferase (APT) family kinase protein